MPATSGRTQPDPLARLVGRSGRSSLAAPQTADAFANQLARGLGAAMKNGSGAVTIRLNPESLGQMRISILLPSEAAKDSVLSARFEAESDTARQLIERSFPQLRHALAQRGLEVGRLEVADVQPRHGHAAEPEQTTARAEVPQVGTPRAEESSGGPSDAQVSPDGGGNAEGRAQDGSSDSGSRTGMDARTWSDGSKVTEEQPLEDLTRSVEVWGWTRSGRSAAIYKVASTDGGAARIMVDAMA